MSTKPIEPSGSKSSDLADRFIAASNARPADRVTIAGHENFELLIVLCRRGFMDVECRVTHCTPGAATAPADFLFIPHLTSERDLLNILGQRGHALARDGVLCIEMLADTEESTERALRSVLSERGFAAIESTIGPVGQSRLWRIARPSLSLARAA